MGGRRSTSNAPEFFDDTIPEVDVYNFQTGEWTTISKLGRPRGGAAATVHGNNVYLLGGEGSNRAWTEVDVLNGANFKPVQPLPEPRHGTGVVSCGGAMWIAGGARVQGGGNNAKDTYAFFDGDKPPVCSFQKISPINKSMEDAATELSEDADVSTNNISTDTTLSFEATFEPWPPTPTTIQTPEVQPIEVPEHTPFSKPEEFSFSVVSTPSTVNATPEPSPIIEIEDANPVISQEVPVPTMEFTASSSPDVEPTHTQAFAGFGEAFPGSSMMPSDISTELTSKPFVSSPSPSSVTTIASTDVSMMDQTDESPDSTKMREEDPTSNLVTHSTDSSSSNIVVSKADSPHHGSMPSVSFSPSPNSVPVPTEPAVPSSSLSQVFHSHKPSIAIEASAGESKDDVDENNQRGK